MQQTVEGGIYMAKCVSRENFIEKLSFYLSFHFNEDENTSITKDYDDWFENEASQGKNEAEICAALEEPQKIVKNLLSESGSNSNQISILLHNTVIQVFLLIIMQFLISLSLLRFCNQNSINFVDFALSINFLYFVAGSVIIKKSNQKTKYNKSIRSIFYLAVLILLFELMLPRISNTGSGKVCVLVLGTFSLILFLMNLYFAMRNIIHDKQLTFLSTFHISGIITLIFFVINQLHMLYNGMSEYHYLIYESVCIYFEIIILHVVICKRKINAEE